MIHRALLRCWAVLMLGLLAACASTPIPASPAPTASGPTRAPVAPTVAVVIAPTAGLSQATAVAPAAGTAPPGNAAIPENLTPEGYHVLGRPDAPVTLVMYSDFL